MQAVDKRRFPSQFPLIGLWISPLLLATLRGAGQSRRCGVKEREICTHCGAPAGALADAQQRLIEAAIRYAIATRPNGHPVDSAFRRAVSELTGGDQGDLRDDLGQTGVGETR